ncbi:phage replisome organizer [Serratia marcescens]
MANSWLRLWHDMPNDPKWRTIARKSKQGIGDVIAVYLHVLVNASSASETTGNAGVTQGSATERGRIKNLCADDIASSLDLDIEQVEQILAAMQGKVLDGDFVTGWAKRQPKREDDSAARVKAFREKKRAEKAAAEGKESSKETTGKAGVTQGNAPDKDPDTDTDLKDKTPHIKRAGAIASPTGESAPPEFVDESWPDDPALKFPMTAGWQPSSDFRQRAALWGKALSGPELGYTPAELASFVAYWQPEGKAFHQAQWELKFADHLRKQPAAAPAGGGSRRRGSFEPSGNYDEKPAGFS